MKKIVLILLLVFSLILVTGCSNDASESDAQKISNALHKEGIISDDYKFIEKYAERNYRSESMWTTTYYIYKNSDGEYMAVYYGESNKKNTGCDYKVAINKNIKLNTSYTPVKEDEYYSDENEKYNFRGSYLDQYCVVDHSFLFFSNYEITKIDNIVY